MLDGRVAKEVSPGDLMEDVKKKEMMEDRCAAYWTTLAPNVEDYSGMAAKMIAAGSGQLIKGILWCGDVTVDRLRWGNEVMKKRMKPGSSSEINPDTLKRIKRFVFFFFLAVFVVLEGCTRAQLFAQPEAWLIMGLLGAFVSNLA